MADHIFGAEILLSASAMSAVPVFIAPYSGYIERINMASRNAPLADAGSTTVGNIEIRFKNERSGSYLTNAQELVGNAALSAISCALIVANLELRKGDVVSLNQRVSALSSPTEAGWTAISFHLRENRYGGQITQSYQTQ